MARFYSKLIHRVLIINVEFAVWVDLWRGRDPRRRNDELQGRRGRACDARLAPLPRPLGLSRMLIPGEM